MKKMNTEMFILRSTQIFGDYFDYSLLDCIEEDNRRLICPSHNIVIINDDDHLQSKTGCYIIINPKLYDILFRVNNYITLRVG